MPDHILAERMTEVTKATDPDGLILEAWAQGFMVGSLIVMICITLSNIKRGVILHKLILVEVRNFEIMYKMHATDLDVALLGFMAWHLYLQSCSCLRMVPICYCCLLEHVMESSQLYCVDEDQGFYGTKNYYLLPGKPYLSPTILGA
jgi:hypothetical protein